MVHYCKDIMSRCAGYDNNHGGNSDDNDGSAAAADDDDSNDYGGDVNASIIYQNEDIRRTLVVPAFYEGYHLQQKGNKKLLRPPRFL